MEFDNNRTVQTPVIHFVRKIMIFYRTSITIIILLNMDKKANAKVD